MTRLPAHAFPVAVVEARTATGLSPVNVKTPKTSLLEPSGLIHPFVYYEKRAYFTVVNKITGGEGSLYTEYNKTVTLFGRLVWYAPF